MADYREGFSGERPVEHFVFDHETGRELALSQEGDVNGFTAGERVRYSDSCYDFLAGKETTIVGFSADGRVWARLDGHTGCHWILDEQTPTTFEKPANSFH